MPTTFNQIISDARVDLNDVAATRYSAADMLRFANDGIREVKKVRPDLFFGAYTTALSTYLGTDNIPLDDLYVTFMKDYIVFRAGMREDEENSAARATAFFQRFKSGLMTA
jgi:ABC-type transporter Mla subunit MlaD